MVKSVGRTYRLLIFLAVLVTLCINILPNFVYAASSPWTQTDWSGGAGQTSFSNATMFDSSSNIDFSTTAGQFTLSQTSNWFNSSWKYRKQITFDNSAQAENLIDFPVLVTLSSSNFDYSKAKSDGSDLRFTDSNGTTSLPYEIESYNTAGSSYIWVKVPQIDASSTTDSIYIYYGNSSATDAQNASGVWNSNFEMVQHLKETSGITTVDSTLNGNNGSKVSATEPNPVTSQVNGGQFFDGINDRITVNDHASLRPGNGSWTVSLWANPANVSTTISMISKRTSSGSFEQWSLYICGGPGCSSNGQRLAGLMVENTFTNYRQSLSNSNVADGNLHQFTMVADQAADRIRLYSDGVELTVSQSNLGVAWPNITNTDPVRFGNDNGTLFFNGTEDEVRVSNIARSAAWIAASYKSEANTFDTFGSEQGQFSASPGTVTSSIFDSGGSSDWGILTYTVTTPTNTTATVKMRSSNSATMTGAPVFTTCTGITSGSDISSNNCITDGQQYIQYQVTLTSSDLGVSPTFQDISIVFSPTPTPSLTPTPTTTSSSSSSSSNASPPTCGDSIPTQIPTLSKITATSNSETLFINLPEGNYDFYTVSYGYDNKTNNFGAVFPKPAKLGLIEQKINDLSSNTTYYFNVALRHGCSNGPISNTLSKQTLGLGNGIFASNPSAIPTSVQKNSPTPTQITPSPSPIPTPISQVISLPKPKPSFFDDIAHQIAIVWSNIFSGLNSIPSKIAYICSGIGQTFHQFQNQIATSITSWFSPTPTLISELKATKIGKDYVVISWKTNHKATSKVSYGSSYDYGQDVQSNEKVTEHQIKVTGLKPNTIYYYEVMSQGRSYVFDARHEFKTLAE